MKNIGEIVTKDECILISQTIKFTSNNNLIIFACKDHQYKLGDIVSISNFITPTIFLSIYDDNNNIVLDIPNGANFMKIFYKHDIKTFITSEYFEIELSGVKGIKDNNNCRTFYGIPIDVINSRHKIIFDLNPRDYDHLNLSDSYFEANPNYFFIKFNIVSGNATNKKIKNHLFKLMRHYVAGINFDNLINLKDGAIIKYRDNDNFGISLCDNIPLYDDCYNVKHLCVSKIINTRLCGQVNNYIMNLGKTYNNIYQVKLCSTEFPNIKNSFFIKGIFNKMEKRIVLITGGTGTFGKGGWKFVQPFNKPIYGDLARRRE